MGITFLRRATLSSVALAAIALAGAPPAIAAPGAAAEKGTISGRLTTSAGAGVDQAWVGLYRESDWGFMGGTMTDADGRYTFDGVNPGTYLIEFDPSDGPSQFYRQKPDIWEADPVTVTAGATVTVDDQLVPTGVLTGQLRTAEGAPLEYVYVTARDTERGDWSGGTTDSEGRYRLHVRPGRYVVSFQPIPGSYQEQYIPGKLDSDDAERFEVRADEETVADDVVLPVGSLSGKFLDQAGEPVSKVGVTIYTANGSYVTYGRTNANGVFRMPTLLAGSYRVGFEIKNYFQYFRGKLSLEDADTVEVRGGESTRITERRLGTGSVRITAVDAVTGEPVNNFCVQDVCGSGSVTVDGLPKGKHDLYVYTKHGTYHAKELVGVRVGAGKTTERTVKLRPAAVITTTVVDAATGQPVAGVCVAAFRPKQAKLLDGYAYCSNRNGRVRVGLLDTAEYRLFVNPQDPTYGRQWVGPNGGTGDEREAAVISAKVGETVTAPQIKLDRAGTISGRVTDAATGDPIENAWISVLTAHPGVGVTDAVTDADGRYTLERLGPYEWPVITQAWDYASQWSGGATSRYTATPIRVTAGGDTTHDVALTTGSEVTGTFTNADGVPFKYGHVIARNAETGDIAGHTWMENGQFTMRVTGPQRIFFTYDVTFQDERFFDGRYTVIKPDGTKTVPRFQVPASGTLTVDLVVPTD